MLKEIRVPLSACRNSRIRRSTLTRIVTYLVEITPNLGPEEDVVNHLCTLAGPGLAPESDHPREVEPTLRRKRPRQEVFVMRVDRESAQRAAKNTDHSGPEITDSGRSVSGATGCSWRGHAHYW